MKKALLIISLIAAGFFSIGAVSSFLIKDSDGDTMPMGTSGILTLPGNLTGGPNGPVIEIDHSTDLLNAGTFTHAMLDAHATYNAVHYTQAAIDHATIQNRGTQTHAQIDSHVADAAKHFTESSIQHQNVTGAGTQTHAQIDSHVADSTMHYTQAAIEHSLLTGAAGYRNHSAIDADAGAMAGDIDALETHAADASIHFPIFDNASTLYTDKVWSSSFTDSAVDAKIAAAVISAGAGNMNTSVYDVDNNGIVDSVDNVPAALSVTDDTTTVTDVSTLRFPPSGFTVTNDGSGQATVTNLGGSGGGLVVDVDTTCYVATTGSDTTGDGTSGSPYATPHQCLDVYAGYIINSDVWLTVEIADGVYALDTPITVSNPYGGRIRITGAHTYTTTVSSVSSSSGSAGNYDIVLNVGSVSNMAVDDYVIIRASSGGTNPTYLEGAWPITAIGSGQITVHSTHTKGVPSGAVIADIDIIKTVLSFSASNAVWLSSNTIGSIDNLILSGPYSGVYDPDIGNGIVLYNGAGISSGASFGCVGFYWGAWINTNSFAVLDYAVFSGNVRALSPTSGGAIQAWYATITGNSHSGAYVVQGILQSHYSLYSGNLYGIYANYGSNTLSNTTVFSGNTTAILAEKMSIVTSSPATFSGNTTNSSPANGVVGNNNALVLY